ncbi:uncharacterized protein LOC142765327 isoform X1 [Rhipicephalus microplus]|uniref:uncharacterized protein LOC142765327 isoform X1 n=2 Tax=Rhipicephalus microplus TaxID=6941 RepID=UPI003F6B3916
MQRRLTRVRFTAPPPNVRLLAGGRLALVSFTGSLSADRTGTALPLSLSCGVFAKDGRFYAMRHFVVASSAAWQGPVTTNTQIMPSTTEGDTVIHLAVKLDSQPAPGAADTGDEYTVVQTNVSVSNGQVAQVALGDRPDSGNRPQVAVQPRRKVPQPVPNPPSPAVDFTSNVCFRLIRGENGVPSVVPCESISSTTTPLPKTSMTTETRRREPPLRWRHHRPRGGSADEFLSMEYPRAGHRSRGADEAGKLPSTPSQQDLLRADVDGLQPCRADEECSRHASCVVPLGATKGRCVCDRGFLGNGLFCWESFYL